MGFMKALSRRREGDGVDLAQALAHAAAYVPARPSPQSELLAHQLSLSLYPSAITSNMLGYQHTQLAGNPRPTTAPFSADPRRLGKRPSMTSQRLKSSSTIPTMATLTESPIEALPMTRPSTATSRRLRRTRSGSSFVDLLDAQSQICAADFHERVEASGVRDYGEDVAERNMEINTHPRVSPLVSQDHATQVRPLGHVRQTSEIVTSSVSRADRMVPGTSSRRSSMYNSMSIDDAATNDDAETSSRPKHVRSVSQRSTSRSRHMKLQEWTPRTRSGSVGSISIYRSEDDSGRQHQSQRRPSSQCSNKRLSIMVPSAATQPAARDSCTTMRSSISSMTATPHTSLDFTPLGVPRPRNCNNVALLSPPIEQSDNDSSAEDKAQVARLSSLSMQTMPKTTNTRPLSQHSFAPYMSETLRPATSDGRPPSMTSSSESVSGISASTFDIKRRGSQRTVETSIGSSRPMTAGSRCESYEDFSKHYHYNDGEEEYLDMMPPRNSFNIDDYISDDEAPRITAEGEEELLFQDGFGVSGSALPGLAQPMMNQQCASSPTITTSFATRRMLAADDDGDDCMPIPHFSNSPTLPYYAPSLEDLQRTTSGNSQDDRISIHSACPMPIKKIRKGTMDGDSAVKPTMESYSVFEHSDDSADDELSDGDDDDNDDGDEVETPRAGRRPRLSALGTQVVLPTRQRGSREKQKETVRLLQTPTPSAAMVVVQVEIQKPNIAAIAKSRKERKIAQRADSLAAAGRKLGARNGGGGGVLAIVA